MSHNNQDVSLQSGIHTTIKMVIKYSLEFVRYYQTNKIARYIT